MLTVMEWLMPDGSRREVGPNRQDGVYSEDSV